MKFSQAIHFVEDTEHIEIRRDAFKSFVINSSILSS
jgi:hypothetical protein